MRMSNEEFKDELFKRCARYETNRRKKNKRVIAVCIPIICIIAVAIPVINILSNNFAHFGASYGSTELKENMCGTDANIIDCSNLNIESIDIVFQDEDENSFEKHITDEKTIEDISDCLNSMENKEEDIFPDNKAICEIIIFYSGGTSIRYTCYQNNIFTDSDGNQYTMNISKAETFDKLISVIKNQEEE